MRDGTRLHNTVTRPDVDHPVPVILVRTPYLPFTPVEVDPLDLAQEGVAVVIQSTRGTGRSEGTFEPFVSESEDGADTIQWCAQQPWSNGKVATFGRSYLALTQIYAEAQKPADLTAMSLEVVPNGAYDMVYGSGALAHGMLLFWSMRQARASMARRAAAGLDVTSDEEAWHRAMADFETTLHMRVDEVPTLAEHFPTWRRWHEHATKDAWWEERERPGLVESAIPALYTAGWHDVFLSGTIAAFDANTHPHSRLIIGPWAHTAKGAALGDVSYGFHASAHAFGLERRQLDFLMRALRCEEPDDTEPRVIVFVMGANQWRHETEWPPRRAAPHRLYLAPEGKLTDTLTREHHTIELAHDSDNPVPTLGGPNFFIGSDGGYKTGQWDQRPLDQRSDILRFTSPPLEVDLEVLGPVSLTIHGHAESAEADWTAKLIDVHPDGRALSVVDGIRRTAPPAQVQLDTPPEQITIDLGHTAQLFRAGHRIRVDIAASNFPRFSHSQGAHQTLHLGGPYKSCLTLSSVTHDESRVGSASRRF